MTSAVQKPGFDRHPITPQPEAVPSNPPMETRQGAPGRLHNLVHDPATLLVAFDRVAGNQGANAPGVDGVTAADVEEAVGVAGFLDDLRAQLKTGALQRLPVPEKTITGSGEQGEKLAAGYVRHAELQAVRGSAGLTIHDRFLSAQKAAADRPVNWRVLVRRLVSAAATPRAEATIAARDATTRRSATRAAQACARAGGRH
ncbi:hypothetical protein ACWEPL_64890 [Nonomuraea sp. NPDC004186]